MGARRLSECKSQGLGALLERQLGDDLRVQFDAEANAQLDLKLSDTMVQMSQVVEQAVNDALVRVSVDEVQPPNDNTLPAACMVLLKMSNLRKQRQASETAGQERSLDKKAPRVYVAGSSNGKDLDPDQEAESVATHRLLDGISEEQQKTIAEGHWHFITFGAFVCERRASI